MPRAVYKADWWSVYLNEQGILVSCSHLLQENCSALKEIGCIRNANYPGKPGVPETCQVFCFSSFNSLGAVCYFLLQTGRRLAIPSSLRMCSLQGNSFVPCGNINSFFSVGDPELWLGWGKKHLINTCRRDVDVPMFISLINKSVDWASNFHKTARTCPQNLGDPPLSE